uniref:Uncharacterized protein n=1 Tax=Oryza punctata TaxID=4537 RepID=A0A0E0KF03_ORYPU
MVAGRIEEAVLTTAAVAASGGVGGVEEEIVKLFSCSVLTTFQEVAIVNGGMSSGIRSLMMWICTPRSGLATLELLCWLVSGV